MDGRITYELEISTGITLKLTFLLHIIAQNNFNTVTLSIQNMVRKLLSLASINTASRCWVPVSASPALRSFSSRQRCVSFNAIEQESVNLISNDDVMTFDDTQHQTEAAFEPIVHSSEEVFTAGPVNKA